MVHSFELPPQLSKGYEGNARKFGRIRCQWTGCSLGVIEDISMSGMKVSCKRKVAAMVGSKISAVIEGQNGGFDVSGKVVWKKKAGLFRWHLGIEFDELSPVARKGLVFLARSSLSSDSIAVQDRVRESA